MSDLVIRTDTSLELADLVQSASDYASASRADATRRAYASDWADFQNWASARGLATLPAEPQVLVLYLSDRARVLKPVSLRRRLTAIGVVHRLAGVESAHRHPAVVEVMSGISRTHGAAPVQKRPLLTGEIRKIVRRLPDDRRGARDRALLLVGLTGGFRRSELVALDVQDLEFVDDGLVVHLKRSKTDQEGRGVDVGLPFGSNIETCTVRAVRRWLDVAAIAEGPLFRKVSKSDRVLATRMSGSGISTIVKRCCELAGLDPDAYGAHSLRSGLATQAAMSDVPLHALMAQGRWSSVATVTKYIRRGSLFTGNAAGLLGL